MTPIHPFRVQAHVGDVLTPACAFCYIRLSTEGSTVRSGGYILSTDRRLGATYGNGAIEDGAQALAARCLKPTVGIELQLNPIVGLTISRIQILTERQ